MTSRTHLIGLIIPDFDNPVYLEILKGVDNACMQKNYSVVLGQCGNKPGIINSSILHLASLRVDGLIIALSDYPDVNVKKYIFPFIRHNIPIVTTGKAMKELKIDGVLTDPFETGKLAGEHLARQGHENIAIIGKIDHRYYFLNKRIQGFKTAFLEYGVAKDNIRCISSELTQAGGYLAALEVLQHKDRPSAIFALNDIIAIGVMMAANELGLKVPDEIAVTGVDGISLGAMIRPRLTTVALPTFEMGQKLFDLLHSRISKEYDGETREFTYHSRLVIRESTLKYDMN